ENRAGEPAANPYLYIASQLVAGLDGMARKLEPPPRDDSPYTAERAPLPGSLAQALEALEADALFREQLGSTFIDYYLKLKRSELGRFEAFLRERGLEYGEQPTEWEQHEYFDFF